MIKVFFILILLTPAFCKAQYIPLLVMSGESNSGGLVDVSSATTQEKSPRPALKILNNTTLQFETMQLGVNNTIGHSGITDNTKMSWENELANLASLNTMKNPTYLVKTGQGGSTIAEWNTGGAYSNLFNSRVDTALSIKGITGSTKFALLYSQGINDAGSGFDSANWTSKTIARFTYLRSRYGSFPIVMTKFMNQFSATLNVAIDTICKLVPNCYFVTTSDLGLLDIYHFNYAAQNTIADRMVAKLNENGYYLTDAALIIKGRRAIVQ